jgi:hypothetical protein
LSGRVYGNLSISSVVRPKFHPSRKEVSPG